MSTISYNDSAVASALKSMADAAANLGTSAREYMNTLENDVFGNLSGTSVQTFMNQSNTHCENLAKIAKDLHEITITLTKVRAHHVEKDTIISRTQ